MAFEAIACYLLGYRGQGQPPMGLPDVNVPLRARGRLQAERGLSEPEAFRWIQKTSMNRRVTMRAVAEAVLAGELPENPPGDGGRWQWDGGGWQWDGGGWRDRGRRRRPVTGPVTALTQSPHHARPRDRDQAAGPAETGHVRPGMENPGEPLVPSAKY
jgi:ANTAR domain